MIRPGASFLTFALLLFSSAVLAASPPAMIVPGQFNVSAAGAATYTIPIAVPPGTAGMVPALSLNYSSQSGDGIVGIGWSLSGLPSITRCPRTFAQDNVHGSVNYDGNDRFCMEGQRLVSTDTTSTLCDSGTGTVYSTEIESYSRIISCGTAGSGPAYFKVWTKTGQIMEFGHSVDSQVLVVDAASAMPTSTARAWAVNKISDTVGNYLTVTYNCAPIVSSACTETNRTVNGAAYPLRVDYTGNAAASVAPYNSVRFTYEARADIALQYQAGGVTRTTVRLGSVRTYQGSNLVQEYRLAYRAGTVNVRSRLTSVTLCAGSGSCLNPTTFNWQGGTERIAMTTATNPLGFASVGYALTPAEFSGDGNVDVALVAVGFTIGCPNFPVYVSTGTGFAFSSYTLTNPGSSWTPAAEECTYNDSVQTILAPNGLSYVQLKTVGRFDIGTPGEYTVQFQSLPPIGPNQDQYIGERVLPPMAPGDFNGDAYIDELWAFTSRSYGVGIGNGSGIGSAIPLFGQDWTYFLGAGDFDGDGCTDFVAANSLSTAPTLTFSPLCNSAVATANFPFASGEKPTTGDFNGDGKMDVLLVSSSSAKLFFGTGTGFVEANSSVSGPTAWTGFEVVIGDWNGDGKSDIALVPRTSPGPTAASLFLSTGTDFTVALDGSGAPIVISTGGPIGFGVADWNGDGATDLWFQGISSGADVLYAPSYAPELMTGVSNGIGSTTIVSYDRINNIVSPFYTKGSSATYPTMDFAGALYVVRRVDASNGLGTCTNPGGSYCYASTYAYAGAVTNLLGRSFLGFSSVAITDTQTGITQTTTYGTSCAWLNPGTPTDRRNVCPFAGLVLSQTKTKSGNSNPLNSTVNSYANDSSCWSGSGAPAGVQKVCLTQSIAGGYDLDNTSPFPTTTTSYTYDDDGNALTVSVSVSDGSSKVTTNTYAPPKTDDGHWYLGRLETASVASTVGTVTRTRTSSFSYSLTGASATGLLMQEAVEVGVNTCNSGSSSCTLTTSYTYDAFGHKVTTTVSGSGISSRTSYAFYDAQGTFPTSAANALGQYEFWTYEPMFGGPLSHTGPNFVVTNWSYDQFGRLQQETRPDGTRTINAYRYCTGCVTTSQFLAESQIIGSDGSTQIGATTTAYYDMLSRSIAGDTQGFNGANIRAVTFYDANGRVYQSSRPYFTSGGTPRYTTFAYDALGRVIQATNPDSSVTTFCFAGLKTWTRNALGQTTQTNKNAQGLNAAVIKSTVACGTDSTGGPLTTSYTYDPFGNLLTITDPSSNVISSSYDIRGNKVASSNPDMGSWTYAYDVLGQLTSQTDAKSQTTSLTYDLLGRMTLRDEPGLYSTWVYGTSAADHNVGKLIQAKACTASGCGTVVTDRRFQYDGLTRPSQNVLQTGSNYYGYANAYNALNGQLARIAYPSGFVLNHVYNQYGFLCRLAEYKQDNPTCSYAASGTKVFFTVNARDAELHLTQSTAGNGVVTDQTFDPDTGLIATQRAGSGGTVASFDYDFDSIGNLTLRADNNFSWTERFCYDPVNRLTNYNFGSACTGGKSVAYDYLGNITSKSDIGTYSYLTGGSTKPQAVSAVTGTVDGLTNPLYQYDANGSLTCVSTGAACTGTVGRQVTMTAFNMAASLTQASSGTSISLTYDSEHSRVIQASTVGGTTTTTTYLNDPGSGAMSQMVQQGSGTPVWQDYIKLDGLIVAQVTHAYSPRANWGTAVWGAFYWGREAFTPTLWGSFNWTNAPWGGSVPVTNWGAFNWGQATWTGPPSVSYFVLDHLGSVAVVTNQAGAVIQRFSYDAWGKQRNADGSAMVCGAPRGMIERGFTNQEQMPGGCLVNLNARLYDPELGKFLSADPIIGDVYVLNASNPYAYVLNNPLSLTDPTGKCPFCFFFIFAALAGIEYAITAGTFTIIGAITAFTKVTLGAALVNGAIAGALTAGITGGDVLKGAFFGAVGAALPMSLGAGISGAVGNAIGGALSTTIGNFVGQGLVGGLLSVAQGGDFGSGFLAAGVGSLAAQFNQGQFDAGAMIASAVLGGAASVLGGGKFENGAVTASFAYLASHSDAIMSALTDANGNVDITQYPQKPGHDVLATPEMDDWVRGQASHVPMSTISPADELAFSRSSTGAFQPGRSIGNNRSSCVIGVLCFHSHPLQSVEGVPLSLRYNQPWRLGFGPDDYLPLMKDMPNYVLNYRRELRVLEFSTSNGYQERKLGVVPYSGPRQ